METAKQLRHNETRYLTFYDCINYVENSHTGLLKHQFGLPSVLTGPPAEQPENRVSILG